MKKKSKSNKFTFGIIGCSRVARKYFLPALTSSNKAELKIIGSRTTKRAKEFGYEFDCKNIGSYNDVLNSNVDSVYISLPVGLHEKWVIRAAEAGKHIICEKSSTISYKSAVKMVSKCKNKNVRLLEGFSFRFHPQHEKIKNMIKSGKIGNVSTFVGFFGFPKPSKGDIRWDVKLGGGIINDAGCYPISASRLIFEELPIGIICNLEIDKKKSIDTEINCMIMYKNNKTAYITSKFDNYFQSTYFIWGSKGTISTNRAYAVPKNFNISVFFGKNDLINEIKIHQYDQTRIMIDRFVDEVTKRKKIDFNFEDELLIQAKIMDAARKSNKEKKINKQINK